MAIKRTKKPMYIQIRNKIVGMIVKGELKSGDTLLSEHLMAKKLSVSRLTVRKAYQILVEDNVLKSIRGKGTFVAKKINKKTLQNKYIYPVSNGKEDVIGIIFPEITTFFSKILKEIEQLAREEGYTLNIKFNDSFEKEKKAVEDLIKKNVKGIIMTPYRSEKEDSYSNFEILKKAKIPFVTIGRPPFNVRCNAVYVDDELSVFECLEEIVNKGYTKIVHLTDLNEDYIAVTERKSGYVKLMEKYKMEDNIKIYTCNTDNWQEDILNDVLKKGIEVIITRGDLEAVKLYGASFKYGVKIPQDLKLIGYDDMAFETGVNDAITSMGQPRKELARKAFDLLNEMFIDFNNKKDDYVKHIVMKSKMIKRETYR